MGKSGGTVKTGEREEREKIENDERRKRTKWEVERGGGGMGMWR